MKEWTTVLHQDERVNPSNYLLSKELESIIRLAMILRQPVLLTGEPGTGKTMLAYKIAYELNKINASFSPSPLVFNTKTTSSASDLFYTYDAIGHFYDANISKSGNDALRDISEYIHLQALGRAIAISNRNEIMKNRFVKDKSVANSVVLIDEIDKAPRDFPNDILNEIDKYEFEIKEANNQKIRKGEDSNIIIIMTSNSEKNLPDAFLRRCLFYHIPFPDKSQLSKIIEANLSEKYMLGQESLVDFFLKVRTSLVKKKPATAELLNWIKILEIEGMFKDKLLDFDNLTQDQKRILRITFPILDKKTADLSKLDELLPS